MDRGDYDRKIMELARAEKAFEAELAKLRHQDAAVRAGYRAAVEDIHRKHK